MFSDNLYRNAFDVFDLAPWNSIRSTQIFAFHSPTYDQVIYCFVTGSMNEFPALSGFIGESGLLFIHNMCNPSSYSLPPNEWPTCDDSFNVFDEDGVQCAFLSRDDHTLPEQQADLNAYLKKHNRTITGNKDIPIFIDRRPFRQPFSVRDPKRIQLLEEMLAAFKALEETHLHHFDRLPDVSPETRCIPCLQLVNGKWVESQHTLPPFRYELDPVPFTNQLLMHRLSKLPQKNDLHCMLTVLPTAIAEENTAALPEALVAYYPAYKLFTNPCMELRARDEDYTTVWSRILNDFIQKVLLGRLQILPARITYSGRHTYALLSDFCQKMNIRLIEKPAIPELEEMVQEMAKTLGNRGSDGVSPELEEYAKAILSAAKTTDLRHLPNDFREMIKSFPVEQLTKETARQFRAFQKMI
ncbi:MAG: hypothetical protein IJT77_12495 [Clostridia bacterium]|nr:hypothetical protein [Clostridia bacterium]